VIARPLPSALDPRVLDGAPDVAVARVALGLTLYLDQPLTWAQGAAAEAFRAFCAAVPVDRLEWYTSSQLTDWYPVDGDRIEEIGRALSTWLGRPRHLLQLRVVDDTDAPSYGFVYREIDPHLAQRAATLELVLPAESDPTRLLELATAMASQAPILCGIGGYTAVWNPFEKSTAFWDIHGWCKRFMGLDVQDAEPMAFRVLDGIPGVNWLTLVGPSLADRLKLDLPRLAGDLAGSGIDATVLRHALLLRAGEAPVLGDLNAGEFPSAYAELARRLAPHFVPDPPAFWGGFAENGDTLPWLRRLIEPKGWQ